MEKTELAHSKVSPKDVFLHLLAIIALYASAVSFITLIFQYVNVYFPDVVAGGYYSNDSAYNAIRLAAATLIVLFPVYLFTSRFLNKSYETQPEKRNLRIRKWLIYFTLFIAALVVMGDLVTLIYNFLQGELTVRFILKVITVFFVAASIFTYYFWDVRIHKIE